MTIQLPQYQCHKIVRGARITQLQQEGDNITMFFGELASSLDGAVTVPNITKDVNWCAKHSIHTGGFFVVYEDGYESFSPAAAFEGGYTKIEPKGTLPDFYHIDEQWFKSFAATHGGRWNTLRWGSPELTPQTLAAIKHGRKDSAGEVSIWLFGMHAIKAFEEAEHDQQSLEKGLHDFWSPCLDQAQMMRGDRGTFMGHRMFADVNGHLPQKAVIFAQLNKHTWTMLSHRMSGLAV